MGDQYWLRAASCTSQTIVDSGRRYARRKWCWRDHRLQITGSHGVEHADRCSRSTLTKMPKASCYTHHANVRKYPTAICFQLVRLSQLCFDRRCPRPPCDLMCSLSRCLALCHVFLLLYFTCFVHSASHPSLNL